MDGIFGRPLASATLFVLPCVTRFVCCALASPEPMSALAPRILAVLPKETRLLLINKLITCGVK